MLAIESCPPIAANPGPGFQIITGTFQHQAAKILDIGVESESKLIGTTPNHPFWSVDRQAFVRADSLTVGERLQNLNGITTVTSITPRGPPEPVYNLEVQVKHTYYVADSGVLVHNGDNCVPTEGLHRVIEEGKPKFQLQSGEPGLSVFDARAVGPDDILPHYRAGSKIITKSLSEIKSKNLRVIKTPGDDKLPQNLIDAHRDIVPSLEMIEEANKQGLSAKALRKLFKKALKELE